MVKNGIDFINVERVSNFDLIKQTRKALGLTGYVYTDELDKVLDNYIILKRRANKTGRKHFLFRITAPLFGATFLVFVFVVCPIKWFLTGHFKFDPDNKWVKLLYKWQDKLS